MNRGPRLLTADFGVIGLDADHRNTRRRGLAMTGAQMAAYKTPRCDRHADNRERAQHQDDVQDQHCELG